MATRKTLHSAALDSAKAAFLEATVYRIAGIARHPPPTGSFALLMRELEEVWKRALREAKRGKG